MLNIDCIFIQQGQESGLGCTPWESQMLLKCICLKSFFRTEVAVRRFSERIGDIKFLMELVLPVSS